MELDYIYLKNFCKRTDIENIELLAELAFKVAMFDNPTGQVVFTERNHKSNSISYWGVNCVCHLNREVSQINLIDTSWPFNESVTVVSEGTFANRVQELLELYGTRPDVAEFGKLWYGIKRAYLDLEDTQSKIASLDARMKMTQHHMGCLWSNVTDDENRTFNTALRTVIELETLIERNTEQLDKLLQKYWDSPESKAELEHQEEAVLRHNRYLAQRMKERGF